MTPRALVAALLAAASAIAVPAAAQERAVVGITVYEDPGYRGRNATFREEVSDLSDYHLNDRISSFRIARGEAWEVCEHKDFGGRCAVFSGDEPDLSRVSWNEMISSLRPVRVRRDGRGRGDREGRGERFPRSTLTLYDGRDFRGEPRELDRPESRLELRDRTGSLQTRGGAWEICDRPDFSGRCVIVSGDVPDLSVHGMRNRVLSARPARGEHEYREERPGGPPPAPEPRLILYERPDFRGRSREVNGPDSEISDFNDRAQSARALSGAWQLCEHKNFGGRCVTITGDVRDLDDYRLSRAVTSARPVYADRR